jgi:phospholipid/cholesterol/gamma-HCH transport system substrate-binding protein
MTRVIRKHLRDFLALLGIAVVATGIGAYILLEQRFRFPLVQEQPKRLKVELPDAQAVIPGQGQTVRIAGVKVGDIGTVELEEGKAVVELEIDRKYEDTITDRATTLLRTKTGLKDMFIEVDPGTGKPLAEGRRIPIRNTAPDIDQDEVLAALDADTRDYLKLLISGAGKGLRGRGIDLRETLRRFGPLHRDLARVTSAVARRRKSLRRLVNRYGLLTTELGQKDAEIRRLVQSSNAVLASFAAEDLNISRAVAKLPGSLRTTRTTLGKVDTLAQRLGPALTSLRPAFRQLATANREVLPFVTEAAPVVRDRIRPFVRTAGPWFEDLGEGARGLAAAGPDLSKSFLGLNRLFNIGAYNPDAESISGVCENAGACTTTERARNEGYLFWLAWVGQNTIGMHNTADAQGPLRRLTLGGLNCTVFQQQAEDVGVPPPEAAQVVGLFGSLGVCSK